MTQPAPPSPPSSAPPAAPAMPADPLVDTLTTVAAVPHIPAGLLPRLRHVLRTCFGGQARWWTLAVLAALLTALTELAIPAFFKFVLDSGFASTSTPIWHAPVALVVLFTVRSFAQFGLDFFLSLISSNGVLWLRERLFARTLAAEMPFFSQQTASSLSNTIVYEAQTGANLLVGTILVAVRDVLVLISLSGYLLWMNWQLTALVVLIVPAIAIAMKLLAKRLDGLIRNTQTATDDLAYAVEENVLAHRIVRLNNAQATQQSRFKTLAKRLHSLYIKSTVASGSMGPVTQIFTALALAAVVAVAIWQGRHGGANMTPGSFVGFVSAMLLLVSPLKHLSEVAQPLTRSVTALERGLHLLQNTPPEETGTHAAPLSPGDIEFDHVSVRYREGTLAALDDVSLRIAAGETVALVGASGSGKTTLANLLPRFVLPSQGHVRIDGVALADWDLAHLRRQFALVSQDVVMLNDTLANNVALGQSRDDAKVMAALQAANLGDFVATLPSGIDSPVGHNATQLSGGQRQRVAIARALYKDAPILILDEATSALDTESERLVQDALQRLMAGRTTLIIAHRLSTIEHADRVVVMQAGRIVEQGTHASLMAADGVYTRLQRSGTEATS